MMFRLDDFRIVAVFFFILTLSFASEWYNSTWDYQQCYFVNITNSEEAGSNARVWFTFDTKTYIDAGMMLPDCSDVIATIVNSSGEFEIPVWVRNCGSANSEIHVSVPVFEYPSNKICVYFGNITPIQPRNNVFSVYPEAIDDLVAAYDFHRGVSGSTLIDLSGYGNNGTISGVTISSETLTKPTSGTSVSRNVGVFDTSDTVIIPDSASLRLTDKVSYFMKFYPNTNAEGNIAVEDTIIPIMIRNIAGSSTMEVFNASGDFHPIHFDIPPQPIIFDSALPSNYKMTDVSYYPVSDVMIVAVGEVNSDVDAYADEIFAFKTTDGGNTFDWSEEITLPYDNLTVSNILGLTSQSDISSLTSLDYVVTGLVQISATKWVPYTIKIKGSDGSVIWSNIINSTDIDNFTINGAIYLSSGSVLIYGKSLRGSNYNATIIEVNSTGGVDTLTLFFTEQQSVDAAAEISGSKVALVLDGSIIVILNFDGTVAKTYSYSPTGQVPGTPHYLADDSGTMVGRTFKGGNLVSQGYPPEDAIVFSPNGKGIMKINVTADTVDLCRPINDAIVSTVIPLGVTNDGYYTVEFIPSGGTNKRWILKKISEAAINLDTTIFAASNPSFSSCSVSVTSNPATSSAAFSITTLTLTTSAVTLTSWSNLGYGDVLPVPWSTAPFVFKKGNLYGLNYYGNDNILTTIRGNPLNGPLSSGSWYDVFLSCDSSSCRFVIPGTDQTLTSLLSITTDNTQDLIIGDTFSGKIYQLFLFNDSLTESNRTCLSNSDNILVFPEVQGYAFCPGRVPDTVSSSLENKSAIDVLLDYSQTGYILPENVTPDVQITVYVKIDMFNRDFYRTFYKEINIQNPNVSVYVNVTPNVLTSAIAPRTSKTIFVNFTGTPIYTLSKSVDADFHGDYYVINHRRTVHVYDSLVSNKTIVIKVPFDELPDWRRKTDLVITVDAKSTGFTTAEDENYFYIIIPTTFGSSSLDVGDHEIYIGYQVPSSPSGTSTSETPTAAVRPGTIIATPSALYFEVSDSEPCSQTNVKLVYPGGELLATVYVENDQGWILSPKSGELIKITPTGTDMTVKVCIPESVGQNAGEKVIIKSIEAVIRLRARRGGGMLERSIPVRINYISLPAPPEKKVIEKEKKPVVIPPTKKPTPPAAPGKPLLPPVSPAAAAAGITISILIIVLLLI